MIPVNLKNPIFSEEIKKYENKTTKKGFTAKRTEDKPVGTNCSAQQTNPNGKTNEKNVIKKYNRIESLSFWILFFVIFKINKMKVEAMTNLSPADKKGVKDSRLILIAIHVEPQIKQASA